MLDWSIQLDPAAAYGATTETPAGQLWNMQTSAYETYNAANLAHYDTGATQSADGRGIVSGSAPSGSDANGATPIVYVRLKAGAAFTAAELKVAEVKFTDEASAGLTSDQDQKLTDIWNDIQT